VKGDRTRRERRSIQVEVIYLRGARHGAQADGVETIRELLASATPGAQVWLVAPWGMRLTNDLLRLKLIARVARSYGLDLRLVTIHSHTRTLAREAGIPVYAWVPWRLRRYRRARPGSRARGDRASEAAARVLPVKGGIGWRWRRRPEHLGLAPALLALAGTALVLALAAGTLLLLIPRAEVTLRPVVRDVKVSFTATANPRLLTTDYGRAMIPARYVQVIVSDRGQVPASDVISVPAEHSSGEVVLVNRTREEVMVPKGTVVRSAAGRVVQFYTLADVSLPAELYANRRVGVMAMEPGSDGNVSALTITVVEGELANRVEVINDTPTRGGAEETVPVVAAADINMLRDTLWQRLYSQAYEELKAQIEPGEFVPIQSMSEDNVDVMSFKEDQSVGTRSDYVTGEMRVVAKALAVDGNALDELAIAMLGAMDGQQSPGSESEQDDAVETGLRTSGFRVLPDSLVVIRAPAAAYASNLNEVVFEVVARGSLGPDVSEDQVRTWVRGRNPAEAAELLVARIELVDEPLIRVWPGWWERLPLLPGRVDVTMTAAAFPAN
jgi:hypothetical protein